ncbi:AAA family ATPase [Nocardia sp. NPDC049190]|uniref:AAA family ATPase n=1 Tax=Nocardia sp. NPDC049190 TaxID=3155650 RepID=UPI0033F7A684
MNSTKGEASGEVAEVVHGLDAAHAGSKARESAGKDDPVIESGARLSRYLGADGYALYEEFCATNGLVPGETFDEAEAVPLAALAQLAPDYAPTRAEIAAAAVGRGRSDPHAVVEAARAAKANGSGTGKTAVYSLVEAARRFGDTAWIAAATREWIAECDQAEANRTPLPTGLAAERLIAFGATAADIAALAPITSVVVNAEARDYAKEQLLHAAEARRERVAEERRLAKLRAEGYVPLAEAVFNRRRDFASLRAPEMLIPGLIETGSLVQVIAEPNQGKTFLVLAWACSLAVNGEHVIYIAADDSIYQFTRRATGWCAAHGADPDEVSDRMPTITRPVQFADPADMDALAEMVKANGTALVVFDTQHRCAEGLVENSNDDTHKILDAADRLRKLGPAVALVHHTSDGKTGRGGKSMEAGLTTTLLVTDVEKNGKRCIKVVENRQKNSAKDDAKYFPFELVEIPPELRGGVIPDDENRFTLVVRTSGDPFASADGSVLNTADLIRAFQTYGVLWALGVSTVASPVSRIGKFSRERVKPLMATRELLTARGLLPKGFTNGDVTARLTELADAEGDPWVADVTKPNGTVAYYELTDAGDKELKRLAVALQIEEEDDTFQPEAED